MHALTFDWGHTNYREDGSPSGRPIIFLNSLGTDLRMWDGLIAPLSAHRLVRLDNRGHGLSARSPQTPTIDDLAKDALALADHLEIEKAVFVGCSLGGLIAQEIARIAPERVEGLVLSNTAGRIGAREGWETRIAQVRESGLAAMTDAILERWFGPEFRAHPDCAIWATEVARCDREGYIGGCEVLAATDLEADLPRIAAPTLVIAGRHDGATPPEQVLGMAARIPGARTEMIETAGHLPAIETPDLVARHITDFLKEHALV